ncbi:hypothetical protein L210DRAFT_956778 [Boletus edulis BED1]|uniref:Carboxylesterase type B domain-containing protein n=1 Tax=Boletus edulis BED1 TaxID=1328754 RepID=A0AAD4GLS5_BOLED|nr:hypothetical protein L210DRAFT_956778 [Boletus edulis BED1]
MSVPHIPQDLQHGARVVVETKYGPIKGGRTSNGAPVFLGASVKSKPRVEDPQPLSEGYRYDDKDYIYETKYCYQPDNRGMGAGCVFRFDRYGLSEPSDLFVNIVSPSSLFQVPGQDLYPRREVWVNIGYRLSVFGFLYEPKIDGNFGFKDQWLALQCDPTNVQLSGVWTIGRCQ